MYKTLHQRDSTARLYLPRNREGMGLLSVEDCVAQSRLGLHNYVKTSEEPRGEGGGGDSPISKGADARRIF